MQRKEENKSFNDKSNTLSNSSIISYDKDDEQQNFQSNLNQNPRIIKVKN